MEEGRKGKGVESYPMIETEKRKDERTDGWRDGWVNGHMNGSKELQRDEPLL